MGVINSIGAVIARVLALETADTAQDALIAAARKKQIFLPCVDAADDCAVGDGKAQFGPIPADLNGYTITGVRASVAAAGVTGSMTVQLRNVTQAADILSTKLTFAAAITDDAAAVIDVAEDDLTTGDVIAVDIDTIHSGTAAKGLNLVLVLTPPA